MTNIWDMYPLELDDPGANWCPVCGEMRGICQCTDEDYGFMTDEDGYRWAHEIMYGEEDRELERWRREQDALWMELEGNDDDDD